MSFNYLLRYSLIIVLLLRVAFVVLRGVFFAILVIKFPNSKIFHTTIMCLLSTSEAHDACQVTQDCTFVLVCNLSYLFLCTLDSSMGAFNLQV